MVAIERNGPPTSPGRQWETVDYHGRPPQRRMAVIRT
jgi:hypothetical protein